MAGFSSWFWWFAALCFFSVLGLMSSVYIVEKYYAVHSMSVNNTRPANTANMALFTTPTSNQAGQVSLHCRTVCSKSAGDICVPLDLAVFVCKNDTPTKNMTFIQNHYPVVRVARARGASGKPSVLEVERCNLEEHFPGVELIPRQTSCAVVGNSGILNNSSCGDFIDSHDFVIRANMGLIKGYEADVGRKSSLNAFNRALMLSYGRAMEKTNSPASRQIRDKFFDHIQTLRGSILWYPKQLYQPHGSFISGRKYRSIIGALRGKGFTDIRFAFSWRPISIRKSWGLRKTSTLGLDMYAVARTFCSNITLFGFYPFYKDLEGRPIKYHYFDDVKYNFTLQKGHQFSLEHTKLKELENQGNLTLVVRDCKPRKWQ